MTDEVSRLTADVVAIAPDETGRDHVLLIRRGWEPFEGYWALPGGHVDTDEHTRDAAVRELAEETGVSVHEGDLIELGAWHAPGRDPRGRYVTVAYRVSVWTTVTLRADDDATDARWVPVDDLDDIGLAFDHREIIRAALTPRVA